LFSASTNKKVSTAISDEANFISSKTLHRPGGGTPNKYKELEHFIVETVRHCWGSGATISPEQLHHKVLQHIASKEDQYEDFVHGKRSTLNRYVLRVFARNRFSIQKNSISQSVPADWQLKAEENAARIRATFLKEDVDVVINADETFLLFHPFGKRLIAPTGVKQVRSVVQVDNEKWGATVMIVCNYCTSCILPLMIIFTGVYGAKLMKHWVDFN
jgi:hypothetical protein